MLNASTPRRQLCLASQQSNMQKLGCFCCRHFCFPPAFWSFECVGSIQHKIGQWLDKNLCARVLRKQEPNRCLFRPCLQFPREFFLFFGQGAMCDHREVGRLRISGFITTDMNCLCFGRAIDRILWVSACSHSFSMSAHGASQAQLCFGRRIASFNQTSTVDRDCKPLGTIV